jgi:adenosylcobinamide-phosphate synthase
MNRCLLLPAVYLLDQAAGDPEGFPHPVRVMGWVIARGEAALRRRQRVETEFVAGALLTGIVVAASYGVTRASITAAYRLSRPLGWLTEIVLGWTCLAARNLHDEASLVLAALDNNDIPLARNRLARIVGRDTDSLDVKEISRAVIETLAESASDGVIAPIFYMSLGGVPLAMAYKAINTLDSMIGHADTRYFYFGKAAARLDDAANFVPARMTAFAIAAVSNASAWQTWMRDGGKHKSPNAGQPESAMAGALKVRLGGGNYYDGEFLPAETIGEQFPAPQPDDVRRALRIVSIIAAFGAALGLAAGALLPALHSNREAA